jgi:hypothetical protein
MPRGVAGGRPETVEVMRWGKLVLSRPDARNWQLSGDEKITYHTSLPIALLAAAYRVADKEHRRDIERWLDKFSQTIDRILFELPELIDSKRARKLTPKPEGLPRKVQTTQPGSCLPVKRGVVR